MIEQISPAEIVTQFNLHLEQSAYRSVRGAVAVCPVKPVSNEADREGRS